MAQPPTVDSHFIFTWLQRIGLDSYYELFICAGYDLITLTKCTPADLCALGIANPTHRALIKQALGMLDTSELESKLNAYLTRVTTVDELLRLIRLEQYAPVLVVDAINNKTPSLDAFVDGLVWEDLEEMGVKKLGHQKKLMFVCKRLKELRSVAKASCEQQQISSNNSIMNRG